VCGGNAEDRRGGRGLDFTRLSPLRRFSFPFSFSSPFRPFLFFFDSRIFGFFSPASKLATARTFNVTDVEFWFGAAGDTAVASKSVDGASSLVRAKPQVGVRRERFTQGVWFIQQLCVCDVSQPPGFPFSSFLFMWCPNIYFTYYRSSLQE
jgi:hypothetical protein